MKLRSALWLKKSAFLAVILVFPVAFGFPQSIRPQSERPGSNATGSAQSTFLSQYCFGCHNERTKTAGLMLDKMDVAHVGENAEVWEKVVRKLRAGLMPPAGARRPDRPTSETFTVWLENELDRSVSSQTRICVAGHSPPEPVRICQRRARSSRARCGRECVVAS